MGGKHVTLRDVGAQVGLTAAAVSLALRDDPRLPEATRRRVQAAAEALGYRPNLAARALRTQRHQAIGVFLFGSALEQTADALAFYSETVLAVANAALDHGYRMTLADLRTSDDPVVERPPPERGGAAPRTIERLIARTPVDAAVCLGTAGEREARALERLHLPYIFVGKREAPGRQIPYVTTDYAAGSELAIDHLVGLGHRRIIAASTPRLSRQPWMRDRITGYIAAMRERGLEPMLIEDPADLARRLRSGATAVYAISHDVALMALAALRQNGLTVPEHVALISFGDHAGASTQVPPLTVVRQPLGELGRLAAQALLAQLAGMPPDVLPALRPTLVVRRSCGAMAVREAKRQTGRAGALKGRHDLPSLPHSEVVTWA